jgi:hypothetical protein
MTGLQVRGRQTSCLFMKDGQDVRPRRLALSLLDTAAGDLYEFLPGLTIRECKC